MTKANDHAAWDALAAHAGALRDSRILSLFDADAGRAQTFACEGAGLYLDYSKQLLTQETLVLLQRLAQARDLPGWIGRLFGGEAINHTENRAVAHWALRAPDGAVARVGGADVMPAVGEVRRRFCDFAESLRSGAARAHGGGPITDVVNIGIGGSDLGPRMVCEALRGRADGPRVHFVANVDGDDLAQVLRGLDPAGTLFIVTSKTFTTQETLANARAARAWLAGALGEGAVRAHFAAVSTNAAEVSAFGIDPARMFGFWDWVGGRYSLWSAVGLPVAVAVGARGFGELLAGAHAMDQHFRGAPLHANLPVLSGLIGVWNHNFLQRASQVVAPYAQRLAYFVPWLQQLEMESNGKGVRRDGTPVAVPTTPALWGDVGTNAQHAFFQMLHQGPAVHAVDFILPAAPGIGSADQHRLLAANCLAQGAALMRGKTAAEVRAELSARGMAGPALEAAIPHRTFPGNRPSSTLLLPRLDPYSLGALLALYEHRTFVMSVLWDVNAYDQWGVELGKQMAQQMLAPGAKRLDPSSSELLRRVGG